MDAERRPLDARVKLAYSAVVALCATLLGQPWALAALLALSLAPWLWVRFDPRHGRVLVALALLSVGSMVVSQGLFWTGGPRTVAVALPLGLSLSREGMMYGAGQSLRLIVVASAALSVVACTPPADLLAALARLGLPPSFCFVVVLALRFLPAMLDQGRRILAVLSLRGTRGGPLRRLAELTPPLVSSLLRQSRQIALAAEARAWDPHRRPPPAAPLTASDRWSLAGLALLLALTLLALAHGAGAPPGVVR